MVKTLCEQKYPEVIRRKAEQLRTTPMKLVASIQRRKNLIGAAFYELFFSNQGQGPQGSKKEVLSFDFDEHTYHMSDQEFKLRYRLSRYAFDELLKLIHNDLLLDKHQKHRATTGRGGVSPLDPAARLAIALRLFAGGSCHDIADIYCISRSWVYNIAWQVVDAINKHIPIEFPCHDVEKLKVLEAEFRAQSPGAVWQGCVGCIDGVHFKIKKPPLSSVEDPIRYYVARKHHHALLCIAICDAARRFTYYSMTMAGTTHDSLAWSTSSLGSKVKDGELPSPFFLNGDNAFSLSNSMIVPSGVDTNFDYIQSSCRMPIECAFGMLIRRWGILWRPLEVQFSRTAPLIGCLMRLHNWCIQHCIVEETYLRELDDGSVMGWVSPSRWLKLPKFDGYGRPLAELNTSEQHLDRSSSAHAGGPHTFRRDTLMKAIQEAGLRRPSLPAHLVPQNKGRVRKS